MNLLCTRLAACSALLIASVGMAQNVNTIAPIDPNNKWAWQENCGWINWFGAGSPVNSQGVRGYAFWFGGFAWGENIGWINLGDGSPANGSQYSNTTGADFGVNAAHG